MWCELVYQFLMQRSAVVREVRCDKPGLIVNSAPVAKAFYHLPHSRDIHMPYVGRFARAIIAVEKSNIKSRSFLQSFNRVLGVYPGIVPVKQNDPRPFDTEDERFVRVIGGQGGQERGFIYMEGREWVNLVKFNSRRELAACGPAKQCAYDFVRVYGHGGCGWCLRKWWHHPRELSWNDVIGVFMREQYGSQAAEADTITL